MPKRTVVSPAGAVYLLENRIIDILSSTMSRLADGGGGSDGGPGGTAHARTTRVRRNCPWTEAEHRLFLLGLEKYGRGSWRNIAGEFVTTRTATQLRPLLSHHAVSTLPFLLV